MENVYGIMIHTDVWGNEGTRPLEERIETLLLHFTDDGIQCLDDGRPFPEKKRSYYTEIIGGCLAVTPILRTGIRTETGKRHTVFSECSVWSIKDLPSIPEFLAGNSGHDRPFLFFARRDAVFSTQSMRNLMIIGAQAMRIIEAARSDLETQQ